MSLESILVPEEVLISRSNNDVSRTVFEEREAPMVALREGHAIEEYATHLDAYRKISASYVNFFKLHWVKNNVAETNRLMTEELANKGLVNQFRQWAGLTEEENNPLGEYVLHLDYPVSWSDMQTFFKRVQSGDLAFRCLYPIDDNTNALDIIKSLDA